MKYTDSRLIFLLAGEYVLGTLQGAARVRFEKQCAVNRELRAALEFWQSHFIELDHAVDVVLPPTRIWDHIYRRIHVSRQSQIRSVWRSEFWQGFGLATLVLLLFLGIYAHFFASPILPAGLQRFAILQDDQAMPVLLVSLDNSANAVFIEPLKPVQLMDGDMRVWCIPRNAEPLMSIGLLKRGQVTRFNLADEEMRLLREAEAIAVSLEPQGSPISNVPTGPILYKGPSI